MNIRTETVIIGENSYTFNLFTGLKGLKYMQELVKVIGPSITALFGGSDETVSEAELLEKAVALFIENMDNVNVEKLIVNLLQDVQKNGDPINFDLEFAGNYHTMFKLLVEVIKANYGGFFKDGGLSLT